MHRFPPRTSLDFTLRRCWLISLLRHLHPPVISERFLVLHPQYHSVWDRLSWEEQDVLERHVPSLWLSDYLNNGPQGLGISCWVKKAPAASQRETCLLQRLHTVLPPSDPLEEREWRGVDVHLDWECPTYIRLVLCWKVNLCQDSEDGLGSSVGFFMCSSQTSSLCCSSLWRMGGPAWLLGLWPKHLQWHWD